MIYYIHDGEKLVKFDTQYAQLLFRTREERGRWSELYQTPSGAFVYVTRTRWQGEHDTACIVPEEEAVRKLASASQSASLTDAGKHILTTLEEKYIATI